MARTYTYNRVAGYRKALAALPKELVAEVRDESQGIATDVASRAAARGRALGGVTRYVADTLRARRDRVPVVRMGGNARSLPSGGVVGDVWGGAEFGSKRYRQFPAWTPRGRFLYATVEEMGDEIVDRYGDALMSAVDKAAR